MSQKGSKSCLKSAVAALVLGNPRLSSRSRQWKFRNVGLTWHVPIKVQISWLEQAREGREERIARRFNAFGAHWNTSSKATERLLVSCRSPSASARIKVFPFQTRDCCTLVRWPCWERVVALTEASWVFSEHWSCRGSWSESYVKWDDGRLWTSSKNNAQRNWLGIARNGRRRWSFSGPHLACRILVPKKWRYEIRGRISRMSDSCDRDSGWPLAPEVQTNGWHEAVRGGS